MNRADFKDRNPMGVGSSRMVFEIPKQKRVIKFSKGKTSYDRRKGIHQNRTEYETYKYAKARVRCLCPVYGISKDDQEVIMAKAIPISKKTDVPEEYAEGVKTFFRMLKNIERIFYNIDGERTDLKKLAKRMDDEQRKLMRSKMFKDLYLLIIEFGLVKGDLFRKSSWGIHRGRFVLIDYGLTWAIYKQFYRKPDPPMYFSRNAQ